MHRVTAVELGAQSMDDGVLRKTGAGTRRDVENAASLIRAYGLGLGLQMMTGLLGDTDEKAAETARALLSLRPDTMRIYPTIVLENTQLCDWYRAGNMRRRHWRRRFRSARGWIPMVEGAGVRLIRVGLHASEELERRVAGPYHPAFMELCRSRIFLKEIAAQLRARGLKSAAVAVDPRRLSAALGKAVQPRGAAKNGLRG